VIRRSKDGDGPGQDVVLRDVRVDDAEALSRILIPANEAAFRGRIPDECLTLTEAQSAANWRRTLLEGLPPDDFMIVAESPDGVPVGYAWGGPHIDPAYPGELRQLAVHPSAQRQGVGRLLVSHVARRLAARGIYRMRVDVLRSNPNRQFYERLGARFLSEHDFEDDGVVLRRCVYGWDDTRSLRDG
jgi:GNAT superfamily N-acetyltransferase